MATTKTSKKQKQNQNQVQNQNAQPVQEKEKINIHELGMNLTVEDFVLQVLQANEQIKQHCQTLVPCLYGQSGTGKTSRVRAIAEKLNMPLKVVLLHSMLPEEVLGLPRVVDGKTIWSLPDWVDTEQPVIYFFDELDKVREEELGTILTLFADKRVRNQLLPEGSMIIAGMQPIEKQTWESTQTGRALIARMLFVPTTIKDAIDYLSNKYRWDLEFINVNEDQRLPLIEPTPRQLEYAINAFKYMEYDTWMRALHGIFPKDFIEIFITKINKPLEFEMDEEFVKFLNENMDMVEEIDLGLLLAKGGPIMEYGNPKLIAAVENRILLNCTPNEWLKFQEKRFNYLLEKVKQQPDGELEICNGATVEELYDAFASTLYNTIDILNERKKQ